MSVFCTYTTILTCQSTYKTANNLLVKCSLYYVDFYVKFPMCPFYFCSPRVITREGNVATLRVYISGNPTPDVYWRKNRRDLSKDGKYKIIEGGTLQIIGVDLSDEGEYTCIADNGRGVPDDAKITLAVDDPVELPAQIIDSSSSDLVMSLGSPAHLKCLAYGHPKPTVSW